MDGIDTLGNDGNDMLGKEGKDGIDGNDGIPILLKSGIDGNEGGDGNLYFFVKSGALAAAFNLSIALAFNPSNFAVTVESPGKETPGIDGIAPDFTAANIPTIEAAIAPIEARVEPIFAIAIAGVFILEASNPPGTPFPVTTSIFVGTTSFVSGTIGESSAPLFAFAASFAHKSPLAFCSASICSFTFAKVPDSAGCHEPSNKVLGGTAIYLFS
jgi:hypothetical protein